jgi:DNA-directed RNA polymerase specialized sigma24 family protein
MARVAGITHSSGPRSGGQNRFGVARAPRRATGRDIGDRIAALRPYMLARAERWMPDVHVQAREDVVQEALYQAWERADAGGFREEGDGRDEGALTAWVSVFLERRCVDALRAPAARREVPASDALDLLPEAGPGPDAEALIAGLAAEEERETLWELVAAADLSEKQVECLLARLRNESGAETGARLGITGRCAAAHYHAAVTKIRAAWAARLAETGGKL